MAGLLSLKWNNHHSSFLSMLSSIRSKESYSDATLACDGKFYCVHKFVLATCSSYFKEMFDNTNCKHPIIVLKDVSSRNLEDLLDFMYLGEVNVPQEKLGNLIKVAECLKIKGLAVPDDLASDEGSSKLSRKNDSVSSPVSKKRKVSPESNSEKPIDKSPCCEEKTASNEGVREKDESKSEKVATELPLNFEISQEDSCQLASDTQEVTSVIKQEQVEKSPAEEQNAVMKSLEKHLNVDTSKESAIGVLPDTFSDSGSSFSMEFFENHTSKGNAVNDSKGFFDSNLMPPCNDLASALLGSTSTNDILSNGISPFLSPPSSFEEMAPSSKFLSSSKPPANSFSNVSNLSPQQKIYECSHCSYKSPFSCNIKKHLLVHAGVKPFACSMCDYRATEKSNLNKHVKRHHADTLNILPPILF